ncbi:MAG TPA: C40 family peptidase [Streptosporangiaceae bacterium]
MQGRPGTDDMGAESLTERLNASLRDRAVRRDLASKAATGGIGAVLTLALTMGGFAAFSLDDHPANAAVAATNAGFSGVPARPDSSPGVGIANQIVPVAPLAKLHTADVLVRVPNGVTPKQTAAITAMKGVDSVEQVDYARTTIAGHQATVLGVNPSTFRTYTPKPTAGSDALWSNVSAGDMAVSFDMGQETRLPLGQAVDVRSSFPARLRVGAFATMLSGVDAVVSNATAQGLGIPRGNALLLSAGKADPVKLDAALRKALPKGSAVEFLRSRQPVSTTRPGQTAPDQPTPTPTPSSPTDSHGFLSQDRIAIAIKAGYTKLGRPYVWGAEGPNAFDCSGLVQWAFGKAGVAMPRVTDQQFLTGKHLPYSQARQGDLLFWRNDPTAPNYVSHVAIYLGQGKMLVAPHTGDVVKIEDVYLSNFAGAVRIQVR